MSHYKDFKLIPSKAGGFKILQQTEAGEIIWPRTYKTRDEAVDDIQRVKRVEFTANQRRSIKTREQYV